MCFLASHTNTAARAEQFGWLLDSVRSQQPRPPRLYVSWSASPAAEPSVRRVLERSRWPGLHLVEQSAKLTQFEHLRELVRKLQAGATSAPLPAWVYFTDDDDVWSERRHELFASHCRRADARTSALVCSRKARPASKHGHTSELRDAAAVRAALAAGEARLTDLHALDLANESFNMDEYFDYAVPLVASDCC